MTLPIVCNWLGMACLLVGYFLLSSRKPIPGVVLTFVGCVFVGVWAVSVRAVPIVLTEIVFIVVSVVQFVRLVRHK